MFNKPNKKGMYFLIIVSILVFAYFIASWTILPHEATIEYPGHGTYSGEYKGKLFDGQGTYASINGCVYTGEFKEGQYHGQGAMTFANGDKYSGAWCCGQMHGKGIITHADGSKVLGIWENGKLKQVSKQ